MVCTSCFISIFHTQGSLLFFGSQLGYTKIKTDSICPGLSTPLDYNKEEGSLPLLNTSVHPLPYHLHSGAACYSLVWGGVLNSLQSSFMLG